MSPTRPLRVLSVNIRRLRDSRDAVVQVLRGSQADVVAVQEVTRGPLGALRMRRLARAAGLERLRTPGSRTTGLLVRPGLRVLRASGVRLPARLGRTRRGLAVADLGDVRVVAVHLGLDRAERLRHVGRLRLLLQASGTPTVVAGDLNEPPGGPTWVALGRHLRDLGPSSGPTYPATVPEHRIDAVLATPPVRAADVQVRRDDVARAASDHLPVLVGVDLSQLRTGRPASRPGGPR